MRELLFTVVATTLGLVSPGASAVQDATLSGQAFISGSWGAQGAQLSFFGSAITFFDGGGGVQAATAIANAGETPSVSAFATEQDPLGSASANAGLQYWFEILGPGGQVAVDLHAVGGTGTTDPPQASGAILSMPEEGGVLACAGTLLCYGGQSSFTLDETLILPTNQEFSIFIGAAANLPVEGDTATLASAYVDPALTISASQADPASYSLILSPNLLELPPVPEPDGALTVLVGLAALWSLRWTHGGGNSRPRAARDRERPVSGRLSGTGGCHNQLAAHCLSVASRDAYAIHHCLGNAGAVPQVLR